MDDTKLAAASRFRDLGEGCFLDEHALHRAEDGSYYHLEWSPTLNKKPQTQEKCVALADGCQLLGGGWKAPEVHELAGLVDRTLREPASAAPDTRDDWYWSRTPLISSDGASSSVCAWFMDFGNGYVPYGHRNYGGFVRACRRVPARQ